MKISAFLPILFFILNSFQLYSSNSFRSKKESTYDGINNSKINLEPLKAHLPCGFLNNIDSIFIGISDPGNDTIIAYQQAYNRALTMVALAKGTGSGMSDYFCDENGNHSSSSYEELSRLEASCEFSSSSIKVLQSTTLESGELILFIAIDSTSIVPKNTEKLHVKLSVDIYYRETNTDRKLQTIGKTIITNSISSSNKNNCHSETIITTKGNNRWTSTDVIFDGQTTTVIPRKYFYQTASNCTIDSIDIQSTGTTTIDGLWQAITNNLYSQLSSQIKAQMHKVQNVVDNYGTKTTTINRESGMFRFNCKLTDGVWNDNKLYTQTKTNFSAYP